MHLQVPVGVVAGGGEQQFPVGGHDQRPLRLTGGAAVLRGDAVGLLGEVRGHGVQGRGHGRGGPDGTVRHRLDSEPGLLVADLDTDEVAHVRAKTSVLANRRPELWQSPSSYTQSSYESR
ncbi:hypothetical protein STRAU_5759 [Streptomyces aurantiacus JA 4570]|uniref:CN hydrolase domain-containing protein n=1 Tax=Streptomyces aurantiacus JA 4570 TaxID=1286094 RepID=S4AI56_9ACTN|nr:hypothetical protein STRAU_5759 [Streptomyces aurantiacus JA 4570]